MNRKPNPLTHIDVPQDSAAANLTRNLDLVPAGLRDLVAAGLVSVPAAAKFLGIGKSLLYQMMDRGELRYVKIHGRRLIPRLELERYAAEHLVLHQGG